MITQASNTFVPRETWLLPRGTWFRLFLGGMAPSGTWLAPREKHA